MYILRKFRIFQHELYKTTNIIIKPKLFKIYDL